VALQTGIQKMIITIGAMPGIEPMDGSKVG
jgi:hypothetical protein